ncbi:rhombosortase [Nibricoccus aquaticus]|uniref:Rhombosortase n=1 Tax=Nibricoccus aquaticus TaxID=2576891 RepID=A0A290Q6S3_9BACT|nr:rhombosortase [Nibricoccus aquaticus]ATC64123.1 rhombosortase [Nibricoccus aquaticus]
MTLRERIARENITLRSLPWGFLAVAVASTISIAMPAWREALLYNRTGIEAGEAWRLWTGNFVHFGWLHFVADTGLWLIIGWFVERAHPTAARVSIPLCALAVTGAVYFFDPEMIRYAGLSGMNVGFLVFLALTGWQKSWKDWFWPAILGIHVLELILESTWGHGAIEFDTPGIRVATIAHIGGIVFGVALWIWINALRKRAQITSAKA